MLRSKTSAIRAEAVHRLGLAGDIEPARAALLDRTPMVRATACAVLRRAGHEPATGYRLLVASRPPHPIALAGLGETGSASDIPVVRAWLTHPNARGRAESVRALRRLGDTSVDQLLPMLRDPAPSVVRQVVLSLRGQAHRIDEASLRRLLDASQAPHVRMAAYGLLHARDTWTRLAVDLTLLDDPLPQVRNQARVDLGNWLARDAATTYSAPGPARAGELAALLTGAEPILGPDRIRVLRFHMGLRRSVP